MPTKAQLEQEIATLQQANRELSQTNQTLHHKAEICRWIRHYLDGTPKDHFGGYTKECDKVPDWLYGQLEAITYRERSRSDMGGIMREVIHGTERLVLASKGKMLDLKRQELEHENNLNREKQMRMGG